MPGPSVTLRQLERERASALWLSGRRRVRTSADAERFIETVGIALRYGPNPNLPLASIHQATVGSDPPQAALVLPIALTNHLLGTACAIEVDVVGGRLALVHRSLMPALYALVRRGRPVDDVSGLSLRAQEAYRLVRERTAVSAGDVRKHFGFPSTGLASDPAYAALAELRRCLLVDRGPFEPPKSGIPYLSKEGYPYHCFHEAHADLVAASRRWSIERAADRFLGAYLTAARFASPRKLASMFQDVLPRNEVEAALGRLIQARGVRSVTIGKDRVVVAR
jgi:hypothetical protein